MRSKNKKRSTYSGAITGKGLVNNLINRLPFELHFPSYQYCGPGTKLKERLARGDRGINLLDSACKVHDIAYSKSQSVSDRNIADLILAEKAWERFKAPDAKLGERSTAWIVANIMKGKAKLGMGIKVNRKQNSKTKGLQRIKKRKAKQNNTLQNLISKSRVAVKLQKPKNIHNAIKIALTTAKDSSKGKNIQLPHTRVIPIPKVGGVLPFLIPLFAGLSATGALAGGAAGIAKAISDAKAARKQLAESERHNRHMEAIAIGKGLFLKPYRQGLGLFLNPKNF